MTAYIDRMQEEYAELGGRLERLTAFLADAPINISAERRALMVRQQKAMRTYHDVLGTRILLETR